MQYCPWHYCENENLAHSLAIVQPFTRWRRASVRTTTLYHRLTIALTTPIGEQARGNWDQEDAFREPATRAAPARSIFTGQYWGQRPRDVVELGV